MPEFDLTGKVAILTGGSRGLGREISRAFAPHVRVSTIVPGPFLTDISKAWDMDAFGRFAETGIPLQRGGRPEEIVGAALYLASDASSYTNGAAIVIDGGMTCSR